MMLSPSEALYGFMGWLTSRHEPVTFSAGDDAAMAADLVHAFCTENGLPEPSVGWEKQLNMPLSNQRIGYSKQGSEVK